MKQVVELNIKDLGIAGAVKSALKAKDVEVIVAPSKQYIPFKCDWRVNLKQPKGVADMICLVDSVKTYFSFI